MPDPKPRPSRKATRKPRSTAAVRRQRDYAAERQRREEAARAAGWSSLSEKTRYAASQRRGDTLSPEAWRARSAALRDHGVTLAQLARMHEQNLAHVRPKFQNWNSQDKETRRRLGQALRINEYDVDKAVLSDDWENRVGYIASFNRAIVNPRTNYDSLRTKDGSRKVSENGKPRSNQRQYEYLVKYSGIMSVSEYEARYGPVNA